MRRFLLTIGLASVALVVPGVARADGPVFAHPTDTGEPAPRDDFVSFPLVHPHDKHYVRAGIEVGGVLIVGLVDYLLNTGARGGTLKATDLRWDLRYDWPTLRGKLTGAQISLDANRFGTNYASHPFAGTLYFSAARANHLSFTESFLYAVIGSTTWEFFGELRETTSINDLIVTPVSGAAIGEASMQLSGFFRRGKKSFANDLFTFLASPMNAINAWTDDAEPLRTARPDGLGFPGEPWHRFEAYAGGGVTSQEAIGAAHPRASYGDVTFGTSFAIKNLPDYAGAGQHSRFFDDGNVTRLGFDATMSNGSFTDAVFTSRVVPVGYYFRDAAWSAGESLHGRGGYIGLRVGFEYGMHDFDRDRARQLDIVSIVSPLGVGAEHVSELGDFKVRTGVDVYGGIAGVNAYALSDFRVRHPGATGLLTPIVNDGYYHAVSITAEPSVSLAWRSLELLGSARLDTFHAITGVDEQEPHVDHGVRYLDSRMKLRAELSLSAPRLPLRFGLGVQRLERMGDMGDVHAERSEVSVLGTAGAVF